MSKCPHLLSFPSRNFPYTGNTHDDPSIWIYILFLPSNRSENVQYIYLHCWTSPCLILRVSYYASYLSITACYLLIYPYLSWCFGRCCRNNMSRCWRFGSKNVRCSIHHGRCRPWVIRLAGKPFLGHLAGHLSIIHNNGLHKILIFGIF